MAYRHAKVSPHKSNPVHLVLAVVAFAVMGVAGTKAVASSIASSEESASVLSTGECAASSTISESLVVAVKNRDCRINAAIDGQ